jgi:uncharacterized protein (DUF58 family)
METQRSPSLDPALLSQLSGLELVARRVVEGFVSGLHKSPFHGFSIEFAEHREYAPGDDLRYVDWKVFGKTDRIYLKQYEEETNFSCTLLVDASESMRYRGESTAVSKFDYARFAAAAIAYLVVHQQDAAGLMTFDSAVRQVLRAGSHATHLKQLCHMLDTCEVAGESSIGPILHDAAERLRMRGVVVLISDLFDDVESIIMGLKHLRHRRHEVIVLHVIDPSEQDFAFQDVTLFKGLEGLGDRLTEPRSLRTAYQKEFQTFLDAIRYRCRDLHMDYALVRSDQPLDAVLRGFLGARMRRFGRA